MWIAREDNGDLWLSREKPFKKWNNWFPDIDEPTKHRIRIDRELFPEVDEFNSPVEVELKIKEK